MRLGIPFVAVASLLSSAAATEAFDWSGHIDHIADGLQSQGAARRRSTVEQLGTFPPGQVSTYLLSALNDESADVAHAAARALGRGRSAEAVPLLIAWLGDPDEATRQVAADALAAIGDERAVEALSRALGDSSASVRESAVSALAAAGSAEAVPPLISALGDSHPRVREEAATSLGRLLTERSVVPLVARIQDPVRPVRLAVIGALGRIGDDRAGPALIQSLRDSSPEVRAAALAAIGRLEYDNAVMPVVGLVRDPNDEVRRRAVQALGEIGSERAASALIPILQQENLARQAQQALVNAGPVAVPELRDLVRRGSTMSHRYLALEALVEISDLRAADLVVDELASGGGFEEAILLRALGALRSERGLHAVMDRISSTDVQIRHAALEAASEYVLSEAYGARLTNALLERATVDVACERLISLLLLARIGVPEATDLAVEIATSPVQGIFLTSHLRRIIDNGEPQTLASELEEVIRTEWPLQVAAVRVLGASGDTNAPGTLSRLLGDRRGAVRHEAALALGNLGSATVTAELSARLLDPGSHDRRAILLALGIALARTPNPEGRSAIEQMLEHENQSLALRAADALARAGDRAAVPALAALLGRPEVGLRRKAAEVLGELGGDEARGLLLEALRSDEDPVVRGLCAWSLGKTGGPGTVGALLGALDDPGWSVAINAAGALARTGDESMGQQLCDALANGTGAHLRSNLLMAARRANGPCARQVAEQLLLHERSPLLRATAARALSTAASEVGREGQAPSVALRACAHDDRNRETRAACSRALGGEELDLISDDWIELPCTHRTARPSGRTAGICSFSRTGSSRLESPTRMPSLARRRCRRGPIESRTTLRRRGDAEPALTEAENDTRKTETGGRGRELAMYEISRDLCFSAAHQLRGSGGKCEGLHGHNWRVRVTVRSSELDHLGMVIDFKDLKAAMNEVLDALDHKFINDVAPFDEINPSAEEIARFIAEGVDPKISNERVQVDRCEVWESDGSRATFFIERSGGRR